MVGLDGWSSWVGPVDVIIVGVYGKYVKCVD